MIIDAWSNDGHDTEARARTVVTVKDAQAAYEWLVSRGITSEAATRGVRFMDGREHGPIIAGEFDYFRVSAS